MTGRGHRLYNDTVSIMATVPINNSLAAHYYKLAADRGHTTAQNDHGFLFSKRDDIPMNKSLAVHY
jgi:TPR repeat protein